MERLVQPEILDTLPEDHPDAAASRRDLRLINRVMGNDLWFRKQLPLLLRLCDRILELGAGTGDLGCHLQRECGESLAHYCGLDLWSRPSDWPIHWEWMQEDLLSFDGYDDYTVILTNLLLHQFEGADLRRLGRKLTNGANPRLILANEPVRHPLHQWQLKLLRPFGLNKVTRHDGHVSIAAGFRNRELPALLGLEDPSWNVRCESGFRGTYRMMAIRRKGETA